MWPQGRETALRFQGVDVRRQVQPLTLSSVMPRQGVFTFTCNCLFPGLPLLLGRGNVRKVHALPSKSPRDRRAQCVAGTSCSRGLCMMWTLSWRPGVRLGWLWHSEHSRGFPQCRDAPSLRRWDAGSLVLCVRCGSDQCPAPPSQGSPLQQCPAWRGPLAWTACLLH